MCGLVSLLLVRQVYLVHSIFYIKIPISNVSSADTKVFTRKLNQLIIVSCTSLPKPTIGSYTSSRDD